MASMRKSFWAMTEPRAASSSLSCWNSRAATRTLPSCRASRVEVDPGLMTMIIMARSFGPGGWPGAMEWNLDASESPRDGTTTGTRLPATTEAMVQLHSVDRDLYRMLPASMFGASRMSALPATGESNFLRAATSRDRARSRESGPRTSTSPELALARHFGQDVPVQSGGAWLDN